MIEYTGPEYTVGDLWFELFSKHPVVAGAQETLDALNDISPNTEIETSTGLMVQASHFLAEARYDMLNANDISAIEYEIWKRTYGSCPSSNPDLFAFMFGHKP
jgi:hypothetical protein